jgi:hypothetical protein
MKPKDRDPSSPLSIRARVRELSAAESRDLRDRQIAAVGRLLRRAALNAPSVANGSPSKASRRKKRRR